MTTSVETSYIVAKLSADTQKFVSTLATGDRSRSLVTTLAIAKALASELNLPSSRVESLEQIYRTTCQIVVEQKAAVLNELAAIDYRSVLDYVYRFYSTRYNIVFPRDSVYCCAPETAVEDFLGVSFALDKSAIDAIRSNPIELTRVHNECVKFFKEISA
jgi:hypothetical protein